MNQYTDVTLESIVFTIMISLFVASPFLVASIINEKYRLPLRLLADLASFSSGILIGTVTFSIIEEAIKLGDIFTLGFGFSFGAITFSITRYLLQNMFSSKNNNELPNSNDSSYSMNFDTGKNNVKSGSDIQKEGKGSGRLMIIGTLADSHPETIMI